MEKFDFIIIGAGSAGCVLANRIIKTGKYKVLLIEAGGKDNYPWIHIPVGYYKTMHNPKTDWCFKTEPDETMENVSIPYPRGKTLGGSSSINGLLYIRVKSKIMIYGDNSEMLVGLGKMSYLILSKLKTKKEVKTSSMVSEGH